MSQINLKKIATNQTVPAGMLGLKFNANGDLCKVNENGTETVLISTSQAIPNILANLGVGLEADLPAIVAPGDIYVTSDTLKKYQAADLLSWDITDLVSSVFITDLTFTYPKVYEFDGTILHLISSINWGDFKGNITDQTDLVNYINDKVAGLWDDRGNYDASGDVFPSSGGSGGSGAILKGDIWLITVGGTLGGTAVVPGQTVRALIDSPGQTSGNWAISTGGGGLFDMAGAIHAATNKTTPVDADEFGIWESITGLLNKVSWANIKATLGAGLAFISSAITIKGSSTGKTALASANASASDYTATFPAKSITIAGLDDIVNFFDYNILASETINTVYASGKRRIIISSNSSLSADLTITENTYIYLRDFTLACGAFNFIINSGVILTIEGIGTITFGYSSEKILFNGNTNVTGKGNFTKTLTITNTSTINNARISDSCIVNNVIINFPNYSGCGFGKSGSNFIGSINTSIFNSGGTSCYPVYGSIKGSYLNNITINGNFLTIRCYNVTNITTTYTGILIAYIGTNLSISAGTIYPVISVNGFECATIGVPFTNASLTGGQISGAVYLSVAISIMNVIFGSTLQIDTDYCKILGCKVTGLLTLLSGAEYNNISDNTLTGGFTNNSGNTTNIINGNI